MNRYDGYDILDEYVDVTNKIREIQGILNRYREETRMRLERTRSETKRQEIIDNFQIKMRKIRKSDLITSRYKKLKRRQEEIRAILLPNESDSDSDSTDSNDSIGDESSNSDTPHNGEDILSLLEDIKNQIT
jgi:DNA repair ATPase RecN